MAHRRNVAGLEHHWLELLDVHPDDARDFIAEIGAPYPERMSDRRVVLTGRANGLSIEIRPTPSGGHAIARIEADLTIGSKRLAELFPPGEVVAGETRAVVHARLGPPHRPGRGVDEWVLSVGRALSVRFDGDSVVGVAVHLID